MAAKSSKKSASADPSDQLDLLDLMEQAESSRTSSSSSGSPKPKPKPKSKAKRKAKPAVKAETPDTLRSGARGKPVGIYLQDEDASAIRKLRAELLVADQDASQSQILRAGLHALGSLSGDQVIELVEQVKLTDGRRRKS